MNTKLLIGIIVILMVLGGGFVLINKQESTESPFGIEEIEDIKPTDTTMNEDKEMMAEEMIYLFDEVAEHNMKDDCWFVINGSVYDVTDYIKSTKHPGKEAIIEGCGKDATVLFDTRPMGSGTSHSEKARSFLPNYMIGVLE
ncbi:cytochrome b5 domain-containing protein [Patescibacteria group bacterium]